MARPTKSATPAKKAAPAKAAPAAKKAAAPAVKKTAAPVAKKAPAVAVKKTAAPAVKKAAAPAVKAAVPAVKKAATAATATATKKAAPDAPVVKAAPEKAVAKAPVKVVAPTHAENAAAAIKKAASRPFVLDKFLEGQQKLLSEERENYLKQAASLRAEADQLALDRDPGDVQFDEESGQGDSMNVERERDLALSAQALASVEEIDRSLEKILAGTYGICEKCGTNIPRERLKALPYASLCVQCKSGGLSRR